MKVETLNLVIVNGYETRLVRESEREMVLEGRIFFQSIFTGHICLEVDSYIRKKLDHLLNKKHPRIYFHNDLPVGVCFIDAPNMYMHLESWKQFLMEHPDLLSAQTLLEMQRG